MLTLYANNDTENILYEWAASTAIYIEKVDPDFPEIDLNWDDGSVKRFQYVQELINQVVPRKRSVSGFSYIDEDGIFGDEAYLPILKLKNNFKIDNLQTSNRKNSFYKLQKDYALTNDNYWAYRMVDKELLVGANYTQDTRINETTAGDVGLYELYKNVVEVFVDSMIAEADRYASDEVTDQWQSRRSVDLPKGVGMSYCYGCKQNIEQFNGSVANCRAPNFTALEAAATEAQRLANQLEASSPGSQEAISAAQAAVDARTAADAYDNYRGNLNASCEIDTNITQDNNSQWAGLYSSNEFSAWCNYDSENGRCRSNGPEMFNPSHWSGIDCSGLVEKSLINARNLENIQVAIPVGPGLTSSGGFFTNSSYAFSKILSKDDDAGIKIQKEFLKKGDLVGKSRHVAIVYSKAINNSIKYDVIHAYGVHQGNLDGKERTPEEFSRNVVKTYSGLFSTYKFGRIKLWN